MRRAAVAIAGPLAAPLAAVLVLTGCGRASGQVSPITIASSAFGAGARIPRDYTCDGRDISPPLNWSGIPDDATQLSLTMTDSDAPGGNFIHWQMNAISPATRHIAAGQVPAVAIEGTNSFGTTGYRGPCPPRGDRPHHYLITLTAVANDQTVASGTLTGIYSRG